MAMDVSWLQEGMPIFGFVLIFVLAYAIIAKTKILGESKWINGIISFILSIIFISFSSVREYVTTVTPWFAVLLTLLFFFFLIIAFVIKDDITKFTKPLTIVFIVLLAIVLVAVIFYNFPSTRALLPGNLSEDCDYNYGHYDYNYDYYEYEDCDKKDGYYKCYTNQRSYNYDKCSREDGEYQCYDYEDEYDRYDSCRYDEDNVFEKVGNYIYKDEKKVINAFWLIVVAVAVGFFITRK